MWDIMASSGLEFDPMMAAGADMLVGADGDFRALMAAAGADPFADLGLGMTAAGADPFGLDGFGAMAAGDGLFDIVASAGADPFAELGIDSAAAGAMFDPMMAAGADMLVGRAARSPMAALQARMRGLNPMQAMAFARQRAAMQARQRQMSQQAALRRMQTIGALGMRAGGLVQRQPTKLRKYPMGIKGDADTVAGAVVNVVRRPQVPIKLERLIVSSSVTDSFEINDVKIGKNSQLVSADPVPADAFGPGAFQVELAGDTANVGHDILVSATNYSGAPKRFRGAIIGTAVE